MGKPMLGRLGEPQLNARRWGTRGIVRYLIFPSRVSLAISLAHSCGGRQHSASACQTSTPPLLREAKAASLLPVVLAAIPYSPNS